MTKAYLKLKNFIKIFLNYILSLDEEGPIYNETYKTRLPSQIICNLSKNFCKRYEKDLCQNNVVTGHLSVIYLNINILTNFFKN